MEPTQPPLRRLDEMPEDMLRLIVSKFGSASGTDLVNTIVSCKALNFSFNDPLIAKDLNLQPLVSNPLLANKYKPLMDSCLSANNIDAHYIKGVLEYFHNQNQTLGLHHLEIAAKGDHKEGEYLCGAVLMSLYRMEKGKEIITRKHDKEDIVIAESDWEEMETTPPQITLSMEKAYERSLKNMKSTIECHILEITQCSKCFHFYMMFQYGGDDDWSKAQKWV